MSANNRITNVITNADFKSSKRKNSKCQVYIWEVRVLLLITQTYFAKHFLRCKSQKTVVVL